MKHLYASKVALLCVFILQSIGLQSQNYSCEDRLYVAEKLLSKDSISQELLKEISASVDSCFTANANSFYVKGMLKLKDSAKTHLSEGFQAIEAAALNGHEKAAFTLGLLYKDGIGCTIDFDKAHYWFETSATMGNDKAAYSLGYLYLKGLGSIKQDYEKAIIWFQKSSYPMAQHWLSVCEYFGFGIDQNKQHALEQLDENKIFNSQTVVMEFRANDSLQTEASHFKTSDLSQILNSSSDPISNSQNLSLNGKFHGQYIEYDWSGEQILRTFPIEINLNEEKRTYKIVFENQEIKGKALFHENEVSLENAMFELNKLYTDHPDKQKLNVDLLSVSFVETKNSNNEIIIGTVNSWIKQWKEPGPPIQLVFDSAQFISKDALKTLANQADNFIQLYPNPFQNQLIIQYELEADAQIHAVLYSFTGAPVAIISKEQTQQKGQQILQYDGSHLNPGKYIIQILVNGKVYSKLIIKK